MLLSSKSVGFNYSMYLQKGRWIIVGADFDDS